MNNVRRTEVAQDVPQPIDAGKIVRYMADCSTLVANWVNAEYLITALYQPLGHSLAQKSTRSSQ